GIRDFHVTGVQTCALPILLSAPTSGITCAAAKATREVIGPSGVIHGPGALSVRVSTSTMRVFPGPPSNRGSRTVTPLGFSAGATGVLGALTVSPPGSAPSGPRRRTAGPARRAGHRARLRAGRTGAGGRRRRHAGTLPTAT